jgi:hypothetical protein
MSSTLPPTPASYPVPYPYPMPPYQDGWGGGRHGNYDSGKYDNMLLNTLQHQSIDKNITDSAAGINREVNIVDKHLIDGVCKTTDAIFASTASVRDNVNATALGLRDAIERNAANVNTNLTTSFQDSADRSRDIQVSVERTAQAGTQATDRNGSLLLQSIERNAGETRLASAVGDAATRQASNDLARDIIGTINKTGTDTVYQLNRNDNEILMTLGSTSAAGALATSTSGYETRTLVNANAANTNSLMNTAVSGVQSSICSSTAGIQSSINGLGSQSSQQYSSLLIEQLKSKEHLASQGSQQYSSLLLEQLKSKEMLASQGSQQYSNLLIEQLKSKEQLASQGSQQFAALLLEQQKVKEHLAVQLADAKYEALRNKEGLSAQMAAASCESKYEALKNTQSIQSQLAECCCEIKTRIDGVGCKVEDTLRVIDTQRLRDALNTANGEVNLLKLAEHSRRFEPFQHGGYYGRGSVNNYFSPGREHHREEEHHGGGGPR